MPLPTVMTSGTTPSWSTPQNLPVRPKPVIISSAMKSAPWSFAIARTAGQEPRRRDDVAGRALHRLDDDRGDRAAGLVLDDVARLLGAGDAAVGIGQVQRAAVAVGVGRRVGARHEGPEAVLEVAPEQRQHAAGLAVERARVADELELLRDRLGQAERRLDRLGAAGEELDAREARRRHARRAGSGTSPAPPS